MSVVSLFPSATEVAAELGVVPDAVSHQCDHPSAVADRPTLTGLVRELNADPDALDRVVAHDDVYYLDGDVLATVDPDVVLTQGVCGVCALDAGLARRGIDRLGLDAAVLDVHATDLADVLANVERIGAAIGRGEAAADLRADLDTRIEAVRSGEVRATDGPDGSRPRVAVLDWTDPIRHGGLWTPELIDVAGGRSGLAEPGARSRRIEPSELRAYDPEVVVVAPCGYDVDEAADAAAALFDRPDLSEVAAVRNDRVYAVDGGAYFNRHSHRVVDSLELLASLLHPNAFEEPNGDSVRRWSLIRS